MTWIQIIDDDHWCGEAIIASLMDVARSARFEISREPNAEDGRDIYIVDNEFEDGDHGIQLVQTIRERNPDATIVLCTATQDRIDAREAMNAGCNAMIEKGSAAGRQTLIDVVHRHMNTRIVSEKRPSIFAILGDIKSIISAWNVRLKQDAALAELSKQNPNRQALAG